MRLLVLAGISAVAIISVAAVPVNPRVADELLPLGGKAASDNLVVDMKGALSGAGKTSIGHTTDRQVASDEVTERISTPTKDLEQFTSVADSSTGFQKQLERTLSQEEEAKSAAANYERKGKRSPLQVLLDDPPPWDERNRFRSVRESGDTSETPHASASMSPKATSEQSSEPKRQVTWWKGEEDKPVSRIIIGRPDSQSPVLSSDTSTSSTNPAMYNEIRAPVTPSNTVDAVHTPIAPSSPRTIGASSPIVPAKQKKSLWPLIVGGTILTGGAIGVGGTAIICEKWPTSRGCGVSNKPDKSSAGQLYDKPKSA